MEVLEPKHPDGQHYLLREYLQTVLVAAPFSGDNWNACTKAFLAIRAIPILGMNFSTAGPASFFLRVYESREPDFGTDREGYWGEKECRQTLAELGDQKVQQLVATDENRSWSMYLSEDLKAVLAFHGRAKPGPRFSPQDDQRDLSDGEVVRELLPPGIAKLERLDRRNFRSVKVEVLAASGERYELTFKDCLRIQAPAPGNETVNAVHEVRGESGRSWFVFRGMNSAERVLTIQAKSVEVNRL